MNLKIFIRNWLLKDEVAQFNKLFNNLEQLKEELSTRQLQIDQRIQKFDDTELRLHILKNQTDASLKVTEDAHKLISSICDVSVDLHEYRPQENWAVICVHGKTDYVKFVDMSQSDIRSISDFLKQFEYSNRIIDTPSRWMRDEMLKL